MQDKPVNKTKNSAKYAQVEKFISEGLNTVQATQKAGVSTQSWYQFKNRNKKTRKRRSRTLWAQEIALPEIKASSSANVFALMGSPDQITQVVLKLWSERS
jgi:hypothetical protein